MNEIEMQTKGIQQEIVKSGKLEIHFVHVR